MIMMFRPLTRRVGCAYCARDKTARDQMQSELP